MGISHHDRARIHAELDEEHAKLSSRWAELAPELDPDDVSSRDEWVSARQDFFESVGVDPGPAEARAKLAALKDRYRGERIFVIGNGPSLNRTALHHLENEFTFAVNRIYLMFERLSWRPTFYTTLDWRVAPDCLSEINDLEGMQLFFQNGSVGFSAVVTTSSGTRTRNPGTPRRTASPATPLSESEEQDR